MRRAPHGKREERGWHGRNRSRRIDLESLHERAAVSRAGSIGRQRNSVERAGGKSSAEPDVADRAGGRAPEPVQDAGDRDREHLPDRQATHWIAGHEVGECPADVDAEPMLQDAGSIPVRSAASGSTIRTIILGWSPHSTCLSRQLRTGQNSEDRWQPRSRRAEALRSIRASRRSIDGGRLGDGDAACPSSAASSGL